MASPPENSDETFPSADLAGELNPGKNREVEVDPISSEVAATQEMKVFAYTFPFFLCNTDILD